MKATIFIILGIPIAVVIWVLAAAFVKEIIKGK